MDLPSALIILCFVLLLWSPLLHVSSPICPICVIYSLQSSTSCPGSCIDFRTILQDLARTVDQSSASQRRSKKVEFSNKFQATRKQPFIESKHFWLLSQTSSALKRRTMKDWWRMNRFNMVHGNPKRFTKQTDSNRTSGFPTISLQKIKKFSDAVGLTIPCWTPRMLLPVLKGRELRSPPKVGCQLQSTACVLFFGWLLRIIPC